MDLQRYYHSFDSRVSAIVAFGYERSPALRRRMQDAGLTPADIRTVADLSRLPVLHKEDLTAIQRAGPDLGGMLTVPLTTLRRIYQSPGPIFTPEPNDPDSWRWGQAFRAAGFGPGDIVLNGFAYHLTPTGMMFEQGARAVGCVVVPAGSEAQAQQLETIAALGVTAYVGLPSSLKGLLEKAEDLGHDPRAWQLSKAFVAGEPLPPSLRALFEQQYGILVYDGYGTAETGNLGFNGPERKGWHLPSDALVQICDLTTGDPLPTGRTGEVVVTLFRRDYVLVRIGVGDLSALISDTTSTIIASPRLAGWLGRSGDSVKVRGRFVHPRQIDEALLGMAGVAAYQVVVSRADHRDELLCRIAPTPNAEPDRLAGAVAVGLEDALGLRCAVELVAALPDDGRKFVDERSWE
jgi:phenylacetate-CoA ligase